LKIAPLAASTRVSSKAERITYSDIRKIVEKAETMKDVLRLEQGEPDFATPSHVIEAAKAALASGRTKYPPSAGLIELREAIAGKLAIENGIDVRPQSEVAVTTGASEGVCSTFQALLNEGDEVLIPDPAYVSYHRWAILAGATPVSFPLRRDFHIDPDELEKRISPRSRIIVVNSPHNPTGTVLDRGELDALVQIALKHDLQIVSDEVYEKITYDNNLHVSVGSLPGAEEITVTVNSFSKTYAMTGWRVGYVAAHGRLAEAIKKIHAYTVLGVNTEAQFAALAALNGPQDCVKEMVREYRKRRDIVVKALSGIPRLKCASPQGTFYAFPDTSATGMSSEELSSFLLEKGKVAVVQGKAFGDCGEDHLRISFSSSIENIKEGMARIRNAICQLT
jgi:aminotransferase